MPAGLATLDSARRYQLSEARASRMLALLDTNAELLEAQGQTELTFELDRATSGQLAPRVTLRFSVGQEFGELHVADATGSTSVAHVYAAGPIERILQAMGFREVLRAVVIARRYRFQDAEVRIANVKPLGWFCEIRPERAEDLARVVTALRAADQPAAESNGDAQAPHGLSSVDRRALDRREAERRRPRVAFLGGDRRGMPDRRIGDRRLTALT